MNFKYRSKNPHFIAWPWVYFSDSTWSGLFLEPSNFFAVYRKPFDEGSGKMVLFEALIWNMIMGNYEDLRLAMARLYPAAPQKHTEEYR